MPRSKMPEYDIWRAMIARCHNPRNRNYPYYGQRGITVCERWRESFEAFLEDLGTRPTPLHSLDRVDNRSHYEPGNVRWATKTEQQNNTRATKYLRFEDRVLSVSEWAREKGMTPGVLHRRLKRGWPVERALTTPVEQDHDLTKLLHCLECGDILRVQGDLPGRSCHCGRSRASWIDDDWVEIAGPARILALPTRELRDARQATPGEFRGPYYRWFWMPDDDGVRRVE